MASVKEMLDDLVTGRITLQQAAADVASRTWPSMPMVDEAAQWGVTDDPVAQPDSWDDVSTDPRLTPEQYQVLGAAYRRAARGR
jgi:hypothetical protein